MDYWQKFCKRNKGEMLYDNSMRSIKALWFLIGLPNSATQKERQGSCAWGYCYLDLPLIYATKTAKIIQESLGVSLIPCLQ